MVEHVVAAGGAACWSCWPSPRPWPVPRWPAWCCPSRDGFAGAVLMLSGAYLVAYWVPQLAGDRSGTALSRGGSTVAGTVAGWLESRASLVATAVVALLAVGVIVALSARRAARVAQHRLAGPCVIGGDALAARHPPAP